MIYRLCTLDHIFHKVFKINKHLFLMKIPLILSISFMIISSTILPSYSVPGSGTLFGTDAFGGNLLTVNTANGATVIVGNMGFRAPALAVDPTSGVMYAGQGGGTPFVYTVNPADGSSIFLGDSGLGFAAISAMDFNPSGTLYASVNIAGAGGTGGDHLAIIDKTNGVATVIGPYGICTPSPIGLPADGSGSCTLERMEAIAFASDGTLYGATTNGGPNNPGELYTIDTSTGQATLVAQILDASGSPHPGGIASLQVACDGTFYAGTAKGAQLGFPDLLTINLSTGVYSLVGPALIGSSLGALAFEDGCGAVGGTILEIDSYSLVLAGIQSMTIWMIPSLAGLAGAALYLAKFRKN